MVTTQPSRIFRSGTASTLYLTIPSDVVSDSQFTFAADDEVTVTIDGDRLLVTPVDGLDAAAEESTTGASRSEERP